MTQGLAQVKNAVPDKFTGEQSKLRLFLKQVEMYVSLEGGFSNEPAQIIWAITFLRGSAFEWVELYLDNYIEHRDKNGTVIAKDTKEELTNTLFGLWQGFKKGIIKIFRDINEVLTAERKIGELRQRGAATIYTTEFQRWAPRTGWDDKLLIRAYYIGLKDFVKDKISEEEQLLTL